MKNHLLTIIFILSIAASGQAQVPVCCQKPSGMAVFASNASFIAAHENPLPFNYTEGKGQMITFSTPDSKTGSAYYIPSATKSNNVLFVFHEWWGLNDYIKREADNIQKELGDYSVYAVDLYDGQIATESEQASKMMQAMKPERAQNIIKGLLEKVGKGARVSTLGWCMGGGWALQASILAGKQSPACVMYYGFPEKDKEKLKNLNAKVLYFRAEQDAFITKEMVDQFAADLKSLGKKITVKSFDAVHAFANPSNPHYNKAFAEAAHKQAMEFLKNGK